jgi:cysteine desulfuration protein SufE
MSESISDIENGIVEDFELFDEWSEKYEYIIEIGRKLPALDTQYKTESHKIKGCQSSVWLNSKMVDGKIYFEADSDSTFVKGLIALLMKVFNGQKPEDIINAQINFIDRIGLSSHIAQTRTNGLQAMIKQMKMDALGYSTQTEKI